jgi:hypothetical protein
MVSASSAWLINFPSELSRSSLYVKNFSVYINISLLDFSPQMCSSIRECLHLSQITAAHFRLSRLLSALEIIPTLLRIHTVL